MASMTLHIAAAEPSDTLPDRVRLGEVSVIDRAVPRRLASTAPVYTLDSERMALTGVTSIADGLNRLPGMNLRDYGGAGGLKTVSVRGFGAAHTGVVYDGVALTDAQSGQIDLSRYSLDNVEALTLTVGDSDDIFIPARTASSSATLNIVSAVPEAVDRTELTARVRSGSWGLVNPSVKVGAPVSDNLSLSGLATFTHADNDYPFTLRNGMVSTRERRNNSRMNSLTAETSVNWRPASRTQVSANIYAYDNARRLPGQVIYYNDLAREALHETNLFAQSGFRSVLSQRWSLRGAAKFNFARSLYTDRSGIYPGGELRQLYLQREAYATASALWLPSAPWGISYSADYFFNNLNSNLPTDCRPSRHTLLNTVALRFRTNSLTATARLLHTFADNRAAAGKASPDASRLSPSASVSVLLPVRADLRVRLSYKDSFRLPSFSEDYFDHVGADRLRPETTRQVNLGVTLAARSRHMAATLTADAYHNRVHDMIVAVPVTMFKWRMTNLGRVNVNGVDLSGQLHWTLTHGNSILLEAAYSYRRARPLNGSGDATGKQVAYTPKSSGSGSLTWENRIVNLVVHATGVSCRYASESNSPATRIAGYVEAGAGAWRRWTMRRGSIDTRLEVLNIFDKQYEVVTRYPMPGRSWQFTVTYNIN